VKPDVALLDIGMPGLSGYEVAMHIRAEAWGRHMSLIAVTGWGQVRRQAQGAGGRLRSPPDQADGPGVLESIFASG
jgi:CheY-like chemotaxis protein